MPLTEAPQREVWYANGLSFACTRCGNCCTGAPGFVWVQPHEIGPLAERTGLSEAEFVRKHTRRIRGRVSLLEHENGDCEFLARDGSGRAACLVHDARPLQCRTWPFWESNLQSPRVWEVASRNCPGMNQGTRHALPVIQQAVRDAQRAQLDL